MPRGGVKWDEGNIAENEAYAAANPKMKIEEPKTPFHRMEEDGETPHAFPPKAAPAKAEPLVRFPPFRARACVDVQP